MECNVALVSTVLHQIYQWSNPGYYSNIAFHFHELVEHYPVLCRNVCKTLHEARRIGQQTFVTRKVSGGLLVNSCTIG